MFNSIDKWLNNSITFRYLFIIFYFLSMATNYNTRYTDANFYILFIFTVIFLGIGFYNKSPFFLITIATFVAICRYYSILDTGDSIVDFLVFLITYLLMTFISASLMRYAQKVKENYIELTSALANALDSRDPHTRNHSENVSKYSVLIAKKMKLPSSTCEIIRVGGLLHDIGKIGIQEYILSKPDKLTEDEYDIIKKHPLIGYEMIKHVSNFNDNGVLDIIRYHHERYDGKGYPNGLKGNEIPLVARIVSVADTFDAMTSKRVYRSGFNLEHTLEEIKKNKGFQFDPEIVDVFLSLFENKDILNEP